MPENQPSDLAKMAQDIFGRIKEIKSSHPKISRRVDDQEQMIRKNLFKIRKEIDKLPPRERELVTVMVINGLQRTAEEILIG